MTPFLQSEWNIANIVEYCLRVCSHITSAKIRGSWTPPSPSRNGQLLAYPPPAADVICERPLIVKRESAAEVENMRIPNPTFKDLLVASAVVRAAGERHNRAIKGYTRRHKAAWNRGLRAPGQLFRGRYWGQNTEHRPLLIRSWDKGKSREGLPGY